MLATRGAEAPDGGLAAPDKAAAAVAAIVRWWGGVRCGIRRLSVVVVRRNRLALAWPMPTPILPMFRGLQLCIFTVVFIRALPPVTCPMGLPDSQWCAHANGDAKCRLTAIRQTLARTS